MENLETAQPEKTKTPEETLVGLLEDLRSGKKEVINKDDLRMEAWKSV